jgi:hypothetical protein
VQDCFCQEVELDPNSRQIDTLRPSALGEAASTGIAPRSAAGASGGSTRTDIAGELTSAEASNSQSVLRRAKRPTATAYRAALAERIRYPVFARSLQLWHLFLGNS